LPSGNLDVLIRHGTIPGGDIDVSAFLLTGVGKVRSDADMCFYGQPSVASGAVTLVMSRSGETRFTISPDRLPSWVEKVFFTASIHENRVTFSRVAEIKIELSGVAGLISCNGMNETALILAEVYRRNGAWKVRVVGQGYKGGLASLAGHLGVKIEAPRSQVALESGKAITSAPVPPVTSDRISLEKRVEKEAPHLVSLAKKASISLEKKRLGSVRARVGLVLDASGSMYTQYVEGRVQEVVDRILPLAVHFDDDGELDVWAFAERSDRLRSITLGTVQNYVESEAGGWGSWMKRLNAGINYEPAVMRDVIKHFGGIGLGVDAKKLMTNLFGYKKASPSRGSTTIPAYVIFISDGGVGSDDEIERLIIDSAKLPIFWQFVGIGGSDYGILERLDTLRGRVVDNCNFFALDDLHSVSDQELYDRLLGEFPQWLKEAQCANILNTEQT
jgi:stress response protein SCP2